MGQAADVPPQGPAWISWCFGIWWIYQQQIKGCLYTKVGFLVAPLSMSLLAPVLEGLGIWIYPQVYPQGRTVKLLEDWLLVFFQLADVSTNNCFRSAVLLGIKSVVLTRATFNCWECQMGKSQEIAVQWRWGSWNMIYILVLICVLFYRSFGISHSYIFLCIQELYIYIVCIYIDIYIYIVFFIFIYIYIHTSWLPSFLRECWTQGLNWVVFWVFKGEDGAVTISQTKRPADVENHQAPG